MMKRLVAILLAVTLVSPMHAEAAGKKVAGAALVVAGGALIAGAFDWGEQCPPLYTKHTFQGSTTQCVFISSRGSDVQAATTSTVYKYRRTTREFSVTAEDLLEALGLPFYVDLRDVVFDASLQVARVQVSGEESLL